MKKKGLKLVKVKDQDMDRNSQTSYCYPRYRLPHVSLESILRGTLAAFKLYGHVLRGASVGIMQIFDEASLGGENV